MTKPKPLRSDHLAMIYFRMSKVPFALETAGIPLLETLDGGFRADLKQLDDVLGRLLEINALRYNPYHPLESSVIGLTATFSLESLREFIRGVFDAWHQADFPDSGRPWLGVMLALGDLELAHQIRDVARSWGEGERQTLLDELCDVATSLSTSSSAATLLVLEELLPKRRFLEKAASSRGIEARALRARAEAGRGIPWPLAQVGLEEVHEISDEDLTNADGARYWYTEGEQIIREEGLEKAIAWFEQTLPQHNAVYVAESAMKIHSKRIAKALVSRAFMASSDASDLRKLRYYLLTDGDCAFAACAEIASADDTSAWAHLATNLLLQAAIGGHDERVLRIAEEQGSHELREQLALRLRGAERPVAEPPPWLADLPHYQKVKKFPSSFLTEAVFATTIGGLPTVGWLTAPLDNEGASLSPVSALSYLAAYAAAKYDARVLLRDQLLGSFAPDSIAEFAWSVFDAWLLNGVDSKQRWTLELVILLANEAALVRLEALIRAWPAESAQARANWALQHLAELDRPDALAVITNLAADAPKGLQKKAKELLASLSTSI